MIRKIVVLWCLFLCIRCSAYAQTSVNHAVQANIVYRFTKYVDWPDERKRGEFIVGVIDDDELTVELAKLTRNKSVGNQPIVIKTFSPDERFDCHILFISENNSSAVKRIAKATAGKPILIVSEHNGLIYKGACINFVIVQDHIRLEFSKSNIQDRRLNIATELLSLGDVVN